MASFAFQTALYTGDNPRIFGQAGVLHVFVVGFFFARAPGYRMSETRVCWLLYEVEISFVFF
jgi:hypothetical protein